MLWINSNKLPRMFSSGDIVGSSFDPLWACLFLVNTCSVVCCFSQSAHKIQSVSSSSSALSIVWSFGLTIVWRLVVDGVVVALTRVGQSCLSLVESVGCVPLRPFEFLFSLLLLLIVSVFDLVAINSPFPHVGACSSSSVAIVAGLPLPPVD